MFFLLRGRRLLLAILLADQPVIEEPHLPRRLAEKFLRLAPRVGMPHLLLLSLKVIVLLQLYLLKVANPYGINATLNGSRPTTGGNRTIMHVG